MGWRNLHISIWSFDLSFLFRSACSACALSIFWATDRSFFFFLLWMSMNRSVFHFVFFLTTLRWFAVFFVSFVVSTSLFDAMKLERSHATSQLSCMDAVLSRPPTSRSTSAMILPDSRSYHSKYIVFLTIWLTGLQTLLLNCAPWLFCCALSFRRLFAPCRVILIPSVRRVFDYLSFWLCFVSAPRLFCSTRTSSSSCSAQHWLSVLSPGVAKDEDLRI